MQIFEYLNVSSLSSGKWSQRAEQSHVISALLLAL